MICYYEKLKGFDECTLLYFHHKAEKIKAPLIFVTMDARSIKLNSLGNAISVDYLKEKK